MSTSPITPAIAKGRKGSSPGGGKAWTEEEEVYLLQMRLERVAYKKIASHLDKTELACRLHYHQLSHGGNRRKRTNSISSTSSTASATSPIASPSESPPQPISTTTTTTTTTTTSTPTSTTPSSPRINGGGFSPVNASTALLKSGGSGGSSGANVNGRIKGKPLLPKPALATSFTPSSPRKQQPSVVPKAKLRVNCHPEGVDRERLARIVESHQARFWVGVAADYGGSADPDTLQMCYDKTRTFPSFSSLPSTSTSSSSSPTPTTATPVIVATTTTTTATAAATASPPASPSTTSSIDTETEGREHGSTVAPTAVSTPTTSLSPAESSSALDSPPHPIAKIVQDLPAAVEAKDEDCVMTD